MLFIVVEGSVSPQQKGSSKKKKERKRKGCILSGSFPLCRISSMYGMHLVWHLEMGQVISLLLETTGQKSQRFERTSLYLFLLFVSLENASKPNAKGPSH
jgi:hypothetical protein